MKRIYGFRSLLAVLATTTACSSYMTGSSGDAQLAIVNAASTAPGAQLKLDSSPALLPSTGESISMRVSAGSHVLAVASASGRLIASASFTIAAGGRRTAVFTGSDTGAVELSIATDTMSTNPGGTYHSIVGSVLMVNSAPGVGPFSVVVHQVGSDSVYRFGNFSFGAGSQPPPAPYGFYIPFVPSAYLVDITSPGNETSLARAQFTLATDDRWVLMLTNPASGGLTLRALKQP